jgi:hypothetical protein
MTSGDLILSSAYFPPVHYMALAARADEVYIEKEENYIKQSYRNRCQILTANGILPISVPVLLGSFHKTQIRDLRIDYSKRWQQVHLGALKSAYRSSPYFEFYFERIMNVILRKENFLLDLNMNSLEVVLDITDINTKIKYTSEFLSPDTELNDFRYTISPKNNEYSKEYSFGSYHQVFSDRIGFVPGLSIVDLIFNTGPDARDLLQQTGLRT